MLYNCSNRETPARRAFDEAPEAAHDETGFAEMRPSTFVQGIVIGFTLAAAVGPIAILLIQRTLNRGWRVGVISGIGVGLADATYGLLGGLGLVAVNRFLADQQTPMRIAGGLLLAIIGYRIFISGPQQADGAQPGRKPRLGYLSALTSIYALTVANPMTIFSFAAVYAGIGPGQGSGSWQGALLFSLSIFTGSFGWWVVLATLAHGLRERLTPAVMRWVNIISGAVIMLFGGWLVVREFIV